MNDKIAGKFRGTGVKAGLMYGMAEFYGGGAFVIINTFFLVFLTKALGMPAALAGAIPMIGNGVPYFSDHWYSAGECSGHAKSLSKED